MTREKDLKRLVRVRMSKTGESYTAARAQVISKRSTRARARVAPRPAPIVVQPAAAVAAAATPSAPTKAAAPSPVQYAALAGMTDAAVKAKTGCTWDKWVRSLDYHGAAGMTHVEIARLVKAKYKTSSWWAQTVTVGYERIKGRRASGQRSDGKYHASKSRTFGVPVGTLFDAWANASKRRKWLGDLSVRVRTARRPKSIRIGWLDGSILAVDFVSKGKAKSSVTVDQVGLTSRDDLLRVKNEWGDRFDALGALLKGGKV